MSRFKAVIVDDEINNRENLLGLLSKNCPNITVVGLASSAREAIQLIHDTQPDVVFLDIEMPGGNGFDMLEELKPVSFKVIFITAFDSYALNAIKFSALDYILKPIDRLELIEAVNKIDQNERVGQNQLSNLNSFLKGENKRITLNLLDEIRLVDLDQIVRIQADSNYCEFHLQNGEHIIVSKHLGYYYDLLKSQGFLRVHQSHLINQNHIKTFVKREGGYLVLSNSDQVPVSRTQKENVINFFSNT